ncbi:unnamed protein product [Schistocephalus solidus]|uniref:Myosin_tail_1 domain-containing protein n=1 Tax=Schistocephalus solidus TaxID=70667 RepID=A0A183SZ42_SCHSO|nr:unnamed protein product [Schistocephalus solidus]
MRLKRVWGQYAALIYSVGVYGYRPVVNAVRRPLAMKLTHHLPELLRTTEFLHYFPQFVVIHRVNGFYSKLAFLFAEQAKAQDKISRLQSHLEEERERVELVQKIDAPARSQALDYKFRLEQATQKITALEGDIIRLEGQVKRYKLNLDDAEKKEEQLKQDRRKLQRDVREANIQIDELKSENNTLQRKIDKLTRGTLIGSQLRSGSASRTLRDSSQNRPSPLSPTTTDLSLQSFINSDASCLFFSMVYTSVNRHVHV